MRHLAFSNDDVVPSLTNGDYEDLLFWDTTKNTNWQKELIGNTAHYFTKANFDISWRKCQYTNFIFGGTYNRQGTVFLVTFQTKKLPVFLNLTHNSVNKKFTANLTFNYTFDNNNLPGTDLTGAALTLPPDAPQLYNKDGSLNWDPYEGSGTYWQKPPWGIHWLLQMPKLII